jgi:hypothetical protein
MKALELDQLRRDAKAVAEEFNVDIDISINDMEGSGVQVAGERVELFVFRTMSDGQAPREWNERPNYAPGAKDLLARIKKDIKRAARSLYPA